MTGEEMRAIREARGEDQQQFAAWLNESLKRRYDRNRVSRWETGAERIPGPLADFLAPHRPGVERFAKVLAVANQKGGVAKTATATNLAYLLAQSGRRVLLVDADGQVNATLCVGLTAAEIIALDQAGATLYDALVDDKPLAEIIRPTYVPGLDIAPAGMGLGHADIELAKDAAGGGTALRGALAAVRTEYDVIIVDCAPNVGHVTINALIAADFVLIPVQTEPLAIYGLQRLTATIHRIQAKVNPGLQILGILPTLYQSQLVDHRESLDDIAKRYNDVLRIFPPVPRSTMYSRAVGAGRIAMEVVPRLPGRDSFAAVIDALDHDTAARSPAAMSSAHVP